MTERPASAAKLNLLRWSVFSPKQDKPDAWQTWSRTGVLADDGPCKATPEHVPAMLRRRLSPMGRAALWTAERVLAGSVSPFATVYCSRHGEVERTVGLLREIAANRPLSPTAFSLSVHNATAGIHSIASHATHNMTALSAGPDSLCHALLEAHGLLTTGPAGGSVLCIFADDPIPQPLASSEAIETADFQALSLLVSLSPQPQSVALEFSIADNHAVPDSAEPLNSLLRFLLNPDQKRLQLGIEQRLWLWKKSKAA